MSKIIAFCLLLSSLLYAKKMKDFVVATVNGVEITEEEFMEYHEQNLKFVSANKKVTKKSSLDDLINKYLGIEKAKKNKLDKDPVLQNKFLEIMYHAQISKDLEGSFQKIKVSDDDIESYYNNNPEYKTSQILYRLQAIPAPEEVAEGQKLVENIYNELAKKPDSFGELATRFSQSTSAILGGDLGYQPRTRLSPEYYEKIKNQSIGTIIKPFRSQYGWHIVKITGVKTFDQIDKDLYRKIVYDIKRDKIISSYFDKMRKKSKISINNKLLESL